MRNRTPFLILAILAHLLGQAIYSQTLFKIEYNDSLLLVKKFSVEQRSFEDYDLLLTRDDSIFRVAPSSRQIRNPEMPKVVPNHTNWYDTQVYNNLIVRSTRIDSVVYPIYWLPEIPDPKFIYDLNSKQLVSVDPRIAIEINDYKPVSIGNHLSYAIFDDPLHSDSMNFFMDSNQLRFLEGARSSLGVFRRDSLFYLIQDFITGDYYSWIIDSTRIYQFNPNSNNWTLVYNSEGSLNHVDTRFRVERCKWRTAVRDTFLSKYPCEFSFGSSQYSSKLKDLIYHCPGVDSSFTYLFHEGKLVNTYINQWPDVIHWEGRRYIVFIDEFSVSVFDQHQLLFQELDRRYYTNYIVVYD